MRSFLEKYTVGELMIAFAIVSVAFGDIYKIAGVVPIYLAFLVASVVFEAKSIFGRKPDSPAHYFALAWLFFAIFGFVLHFENSNTTVFISSCANALFIYLIVCTAMKKKDTLSLYSKALLICILITIVACVFEIYSGTHYANFDERYQRMFGNLTAGFQVNVNDNATLLCLMIPASLLIVQSRIKYLVAFALVALVFQIGSRLCDISLVVSMLLFLALGLYSKVGDRNSKRTYKVILFCTMGLLAIAVGLLFDPIYSMLVSMSGESLSTTVIDDSFRVDRILETLSLSVDPGFLIGNGPGATQRIMGYSPHCSIFELLSDYGIVVFATLIPLLSAFFSAFKGKGSLMNRVLCTVFPVFFVMVSFCSSSMLRIHCVWVILAILFCYLYRQANLRDKKDEFALAREKKSC